MKFFYDELDKINEDMLDIFFKQSDDKFLNNFDGLEIELNDNEKKEIEEVVGNNVEKISEL